MAVKSSVDLQMEAAEGGLKELVLRWFSETQAPLILQDGSFPDWFQGLAARKDAEDLLKDKALGSFLIRLSEKTLGYILSYKGHDRCRHFVISQNKDEQFVVAGDSQLFNSLVELIEHYKISPIQPFGEFLTSACVEEDANDLYDVVHAKKNVGVSVQALRAIWDQKKKNEMDAGKNQKIQQHQKQPAGPQVPVLPPKSRNKKLTGTVSADTEVLPPVPKRGIPLGFTQSGSLPDTTTHPTETKSSRPGIHTNPNPASKKDSFNSTETNYPDCFQNSDELKQVENRSQSLPFLGNHEEEEEECSNQFSSLSFQTSSPSKMVTCQTYSLHAPSEDLRSSKSEQQSNNQDQQKSNPLYESAEVPGWRPVQQRNNTYTEITKRPTASEATDDTYELIPAEATADQSNTYESLEDLKTKKPKSTWGKSNINWKKFLKK